MRWALVVMALATASAVHAKDAQVEGACETLRQMVDLASEAEVAARAASDLGKTGIDGVASDQPVVAEAGLAAAKASTLANDAADLTRSLVHSLEELCPNSLHPT